MASLGAVFRLNEICNPAISPNFSKLYGENGYKLANLGLKSSFSFHKSKRSQELRVQSLPEFGFPAASNYPEACSSKLFKTSALKALSRAGGAAAGADDNEIDDIEEDIHAELFEVEEEEEEEEDDDFDEFDEENVLIDLKSKDLGRVRSLGSFADDGGGPVIDTTIVDNSNSSTLSSSANDLRDDVEGDELLYSSMEGNKYDASVLRWWEVIDSRAVGLSEEEFQTWRGFLDCYFFDDWSMEEIKEDGWAAIKFWRKNATFPDWGEVMNDEPKFALESLNTGLEEPEVDEKWIGRLTAKSQKLSESRAGREGEEGEGDGRGQREGEEEGEEEGQGEGEGEGETEGAILRSTFTIPAKFILKPPQGWPPVGYKVDEKELEFIHGGKEERVWSLKEAELNETGENMSGDRDFLEKNFPRFHMFLTQYDKWVAENKERLDEEAAIADPGYYPGRRRMGEHYKAGMYELPFIEPGQYYWGEIEGLHIYEGIFININAVHDAWVSVKMKDWFKLRDVLKPGVQVLVEVIAKRDPWRYRFPIEVRMVEPNIDNFITVKRDHPPIFSRPGDTVLEDVAREVDRPLLQISREDIDQRKPQFWLEDRVELEHPYIAHIRERHRVEQELLDLDEQYGQIPSWAWDRYSSVTDVTKLDLEGAREERKTVRQLLEEAQEKAEALAEGEGEGEKEGEREVEKITVERDPSRMEREILVFQKMHLEKQLAQREAVQRDISMRLELGLPLEEWGRFGEDEDFGIDRVERLQRNLDENRDLKLYPLRDLDVVEEETPPYTHWAIDSSMSTIPERKAIALLDDHWSPFKNSG